MVRYNHRWYDKLNVPTDRQFQPFVRNSMEHTAMCTIPSLMKNGKNHQERSH